MAEANEPEKSGLDAWLDGEEAEATQLAENLGKETDEPVIPEEKPVEEIPSEKSPVEEEKPVEKVPVEEKPVESPVETKPLEEKKAKDANWAFRELRRLQRENREREEREAAAKTKPAETPVEKPAEEQIFDPIEQASRDATEAKRLAEEARQHVDETEKRLNAKTEERDLLDDVVRQENAFKVIHPDYDEAMNYVIESRKAQFEVMGVLDAQADIWLQQRPDLVERHAQETGRNSDDANDIREAAKDMAFRIAIHQERQMLLASCKKSGKNVAEAVYSLAEKMGRRIEAPATPTKSQPTPQEKVQQAKAQQEKQKPFTATLAAMDGGKMALPKKITSRAELMQLPDKEQDAIIAKYDAEDPSWFANLED